MAVAVLVLGLVAAAVCFVAAVAAELELGSAVGSVGVVDSVALAVTELVLEWFAFVE